MKFFIFNRLQELLFCCIIKITERKYAYAEKRIRVNRKLYA